MIRTRSIVIILRHPRHAKLLPCASWILAVNTLRTKKAPKIWMSQILPHALAVQHVRKNQRGEMICTSLDPLHTPRVLYCTSLYSDEHGIDSITAEYGLRSGPVLRIVVQSFFLFRVPSQRGFHKMHTIGGSAELNPMLCHLSFERESETTTRKTRI